MKKERNGFSSFAKGLFVGSLLVAAAAALHAPRNGTGLRSDIPQEGVRPARGHRPLFPTRAEKIMETGKPVKPGIGWLVMFYFASAVAMISDWRMKKT